MKSPPRLLVVALLLCSSTLLVDAQTNRTIDDTLGDSVTNVRPTYVPDLGSWEDATCSTCAIKPDSSKAFSGTWTAATYNSQMPEMSIEFAFRGTAVYVFFILANDIASGITTVTECNFTMDNNQVGHFLHQPDSTKNPIMYNQLVFSEDSMQDRNHTLKIVTSGQNHDIFLNFDYAIYTTPANRNATSPSATPSSSSSASPNQTGPSNSSSNTGAVVGGVIGGLTGLGLLGLGAFFLYRNRRKRRENYKAPPNVGASIPRITQEQGFKPASLYDRHLHSETIVSLPNGEVMLSPPQGSPNAALVAAGGGAITKDDVRWVRQLQLQEQMRRIKQEMHALNEEALGRRASTRNGGEGDGEEDVSDLRQQLAAMKEHIAFLQSQQQSPWAQGLSDEPPPEYTPSGSTFSDGAMAGMTDRLPSTSEPSTRSGTSRRKQ